MAACRRPRRDESGAALLLALGFVLAIALILVAIASSASNDIASTSNLGSQRSLEFAADGAATLAVQNVRFSGNPYSGPPSASNAPPATTDCLPNGTAGEALGSYHSVTINGVQMSVFCIAQSDDAISSLTRVISFYACPTASITVLTPCATQSNGTPYSSVVLVALVTFDDYAINNSNQWCPPPVGKASTCGSSMTINSWVVETANT